MQDTFRNSKAFPFQGVTQKSQICSTFLPWCLASFRNFKTAKFYPFKRDPRHISFISSIIKLTGGKESSKKGEYSNLNTHQSNMW